MAILAVAVSPQSDGGKWVMMVATLAGLVNIALPLAIVGENFIEVWKSRLLDWILERIRDQLHVRTVNDCARAFEDFDTKGEGWIDWIKFKRAVQSKLKVKDVRVSQLFATWQQLDKGGTGHITLLEWCELFFPDDEKQINELINTIRTARSQGNKVTSRNPAVSLAVSPVPGGGRADRPEISAMPPLRSERFGSGSDRMGSDRIEPSGCGGKLGIGVSSPPAVPPPGGSPTVPASGSCGGGEREASAVEARLQAVEAQLSELTALLRRQHLKEASGGGSRSVRIEEPEKD